MPTSGIKKLKVKHTGRDNYEKKKYLKEKQKKNDMKNIKCHSHFMIVEDTRMYYYKQQQTNLVTSPNTSYLY